jgi:mannitol/fructose-specific phosphotransferase system IIA component (Ntr-type)
METTSLRDLFDDDRIQLDLQSTHKSEVLVELVSLFHLGEPTASRVAASIAEREAIGSTGIGERVAIPHCRTDAVDRVHVAYGRKLSGIDFEAIDGLAVRHVFIIVAPPGAAGGAYLAALAQIAQLCKRAGVLERLETITTAAEFLSLLEERAPSRLESC